ncbi:MAG: undecaprenyl diphosphate synthase family protein [Candidatus Lokiarchaeota archaeon]
MAPNKLKELERKSGDKLPNHVGIIPDGNRRWARAHGKNIYLGHLAGYNALKDILYDFLDAGIKYISVYALSLENLRKRSEEEVENIYKIVDKAVEAIRN